ncbi:TetR/AcrR family transcriptional regulator [Methanospirillum lacunae]|uniref:TetR/AcrR family transcriptional regulator n=1 Tax=Methanospirillum lacunae TaxID=668570 RepID=A0A2V2NAR6_9EURY|nr:TetR/AcrR family transcriptional regulator [Methanospirillum lacunae]PWR74726.1 TetR/AcrR family transcriptional regulator [Methanospirillum lacunae]
MAKIITQYRDEAKKRIIQAGLEVLLEKGYCNTTMEEIARRLEVTKPALYRYFTSKDELIIESAKDGQTQYRNKIAENGENHCPVNSWIELFDLVFDQDLGYQSLYLDIVSMSFRRKDLQVFSCARMKEEIEHITRRYTALRDEGVVRPDIDPHHLALTLIALFNGMRLESLLGVDRKELRDTWLKNVYELLFTKEQKEKMNCTECRWKEDCERIIHTISHE